MEYSDTGIHAHRCPCGQEYALYLRQHKFETLFDFGVRALADGYAREATANFASALERCFEFYLRAVALERGDAGALDATWRHIDRQSERQLGAFAFAYLLRQGRAPDFLTPQALGSDFRNRVLHRGYIPARAEAMRYAEGVFAVIQRVLADLGRASAHAGREQEALYAAHMATLPPGTTPITLDLPGVFRAWRFTGGPLSRPELDRLKSEHGLPDPGEPRPGGLRANTLQDFQARLRETRIERLFTAQPQDDSGAS